MNRKLAKRLAAEITRDLFTNGANKEAHRLVLEMPDGTYGGGLIALAAQRRIEEALTKALFNPKTEKEGHE